MKLYRMALLNKNILEDWGARMMVNDAEFFIWMTYLKKSSFSHKKI